MGTSGYNKRQQISVLRSVPVSTVFFSEQRYTNLDVPGGKFHAAECTAGGYRVALGAGAGAGVPAGWRAGTDLG